MSTTPTSTAQHVAGIAAELAQLAATLDADAGNVPHPAAADAPAIRPAEPGPSRAPVERAHGALVDALGALSNELDMLEAKLAPVLTPRPDEVVAEVAEAAEALAARSPASELAHSLDHLGTWAETMAHRVAGLVTRVEV